MFFIVVVIIVVYPLENKKVILRQSIDHMFLFFFVKPTLRVLNPKHKLQITERGCVNTR